MFHRFPIYFPAIFPCFSLTEEPAELAGVAGLAETYALRGVTREESLSSTRNLMVRVI